MTTFFLGHFEKLSFRLKSGSIDVGDDDEADEDES